MTRNLNVTVFFRRILDPAAPRGAIQKSFVAFCNYPFFNFFIPVLRVAAEHYRQNVTEGPQILKLTFDTLNNVFNHALQSPSNNISFDLFGHNIVTSVFYALKSPYQEYPDASLSDLIRVLHGKVMLLWYSLLFGKRVLFVGKAAHELAPLTIAASLLALPLTGFSIFPYVSMVTEYLLRRDQYVAATTNSFLATKKGKRVLFLEDFFKGRLYFFDS